MRPPVWLLVALLTFPASGTAQERSNPHDPVRNQTPESGVSYDLLQRKIALGAATIAQVRTALTDSDIAALTNTVHSLHSMRWHRGVFNLLHDMWALKKESHPADMQWRQFGKAPVRLALASTLIRLHPYDNQEYVDYLREHKNDDHEFHRAQVVIGLAFKGASEDIDYIVEMADGDNHFVAQSALTALSLVGTKQASDALIRLWRKHRDTPRGDLILELLRQAYNLHPTTEKPEEKN